MYYLCDTDTSRVRDMNDNYFIIALVCEALKKGGRLTKNLLSEMMGGFLLYAPRFYSQPYKKWVCKIKVDLYFETVVS